MKNHRTQNDYRRLPEQNSNKANWLFFKANFPFFRLFYFNFISTNTGSFQHRKYCLFKIRVRRKKRAVECCGGICVSHASRVDADFCGGIFPKGFFKFFFTLHINKMHILNIMNSKKPRLYCKQFSFKVF